MNGLLNALWIVPILGVLILIHELGHFLAARAVGIRVEEFGMGLPPRMFGYRARSGVLYSFNWIPFGGFVKMYGQDDLRPDGGVAEGDDSFTSKTPLQRAFVLVAGVVMNLLFAVLIYMVIAVGHGSQVRLIFIDEVLPDTPAAVAGLRPGDRVLEVAGQPVENADQLVGLTDDYAGRDMPMVLQRDGQRVETAVQPREVKPQGQGRVGVSLLTRYEYVPVPFWRAPIEGLRITGETFNLMVTGLAQLVSGQGSVGEVAGPIGMGQITREVVERSTLPLWVTLANLTGLLSLNLFLLNLLPLPALDGGRLVFVVLELLRGGRKVAPQREGLVHFVGLMLLLTLMFVIGYFDILRLIQGRSFIP
jgi:regulator of sigma E protease